MPAATRVTNQAGEGADEKEASGRLVMEREFTADFATDQPWHHLPPVTSLSEEDRQALVARVQERVEWFKPDFTGIYKALAGVEHADVAEVRKRKCLEAAHKAGVAMTAVPALAARLHRDRRPGGRRAGEGRRAALSARPGRPSRSIKGDEMQMCAGMALSMVYRPRLVAVRTPAGNWEIVY